MVPSTDHSSISIHVVQGRLYSTFCDHDRLAQQENRMFPMCGRTTRSCAEAYDSLSAFYALSPGYTVPATERPYLRELASISRHMYSCVWWDRRPSGFEKGVEVKNEGMDFGAPHGS